MRIKQLSEFLKFPPRRPAVVSLPASEKVKPSTPPAGGPQGRFHLLGRSFIFISISLTLASYFFQPKADPPLAEILTNLLFPRPALANSIYNRTPWPAVMKGLTEEEDNTNYQDAAHPCFRTQGRSFKVTHTFSVRLAGISVYIYVPGKSESRFDQNVFHLSLRDSSFQIQASGVSPVYSGIIHREDSGSPTFEVYFPLNLNVAGGVPYTFILECLSDDPNLYRVSESSRISDGEASYYNSTNGQTTNYYLPGRKILYTTFSEYLSSHFPALAVRLPESTDKTPGVSSSPKFHPVIFIHGLGGTPAAFDGSEDQSRNYVKLLKDLGYPSDYIHLYSYGYKEDGRGGRYYNYQGDIREIAQGLEASVNALSNLHKGQGGDGKVDIVAHSLGNLVTRSYLLTHKDNHKIRRYVGIGAPFKGAWVMGVDNDIRSFPVIGPTVEKAMAKFFLNLINTGREQKLDKTSIVYNQLIPGSDYLEGPGGINRTVINNVEVYAIYGDINGTFRQKVFSRTFERKLDLGDGLILAKSAGYTNWSSSSKKYAFNDKVMLDIKFNRNGSALAAEVQVSDLTQVKSLHTDLLSNANSKGKILCLLSSSETAGC